MMPGGEAALAAMLSAFGEVVTYQGAGLPSATDLMVIWSDSAGGPFQGPGATTRTISLEVRKGTLAARPSKVDRITRDGVIWRPIEVVDRDDIDSWVVTLERVS